MKIKRSKLKAMITKIIDEVRQLTNEEGFHFDEVSAKYSKLNTVMKSFKDVHTMYHSSLKDEYDREESLEYYKGVETSVNRLIEYITRWTDEQRHEIETTIAGQQEQLSVFSNEITPQDSISNAGLRETRKKSNSVATQHSKSTSTSSASKRRLQTSAKRAALLAESTTIQTRQELEMKEHLIDEEFVKMDLERQRAKLKLKQEKQRLELEAELRKLEAQESIYCQVVSRVSVCSETSKENSRRDNGMIGMSKPENGMSKPDNGMIGMERTDRAPKPAQQVTSTPNENKKMNTELPGNHMNDEKFIQDDSVWTSQQEQGTQLMNYLLQQQKEQTMALSLPRIEMTVFSGDPADYNEFVTAFENIVESKTASSSAKLYYLVQFTSGDVQDLMKGCLTMKSDEGYARARNLLKDKYGQTHKISAAYTERIKAFPPIKAEDNQALQRYAILLESCKNVLKTSDSANNPDMLKTITEKLPFNLRLKWREIADAITEEQKREITIDDVTSFVDKRARAANHPIFGNLTSQKHEPRPPTKTNERAKLKPSFTSTKASFAVQAKSVDSKPVEEGHKEITCPMCQNQHYLSRCDEFKGKTVDERLKFVRTKGLCDNCLQAGHMASSCPKGKFCKVDNCNIARKHSTFLHPKNIETNKRAVTDVSTDNDGARPKNAQPNSINSQVVCNSTGAGTIMTGLSIVPVKVKSKENSQCVETYAFLDPGSNTTFCTDKLIKRLGISGEPTELSLTTMNCDNVMKKCQLVALDVYDLDETSCVELPTVFSCSKLPVSIDDIPLQSDVDKWPHLNGIQLPTVDAEIDLLIGNDVTKALEPKEVRESKHGGPYAVRTSLGWTINGPLGREKKQTRTTNRIHSDVRLNEQFQRFCDIEFNDLNHHDDTLAMSQEDRRALDIMNRTATLKDGHYEIALPWRTFPPDLPNNRIAAERRLDSLKTKLTKNPQLHEKYSAFMTDLEQKGYSQKVPDEKKGESFPAWYLPHHAVTHPQKPEKVRSVFDCAAKYAGTSLNEQLLQGPDMTNNLVGVLTRFRQEPVAVMADIEKMFYQVHVQSKDSDYLRYLWWPEGDLLREPQEYQMKVHLFGAVSSPSCASFGLRKTAEDSRNDFAEETVETVKRNFYVDDCLKSTFTEQQAIQLVDELRSLLARGGFRLTKWLSNSKEVLKSVPESERAGSVKVLDLDHLPIERALGVHWDVQSDTLGFKITVRDRPATRRGILSVVSSVYDPLGFVSPFILQAKAILQDLCRKKLDWDQVIPEEDLNRWQSWLKELQYLDRLTADRCFKPKDFGEVVCRQLHNFADASQQGYGAVSYLRSENSNGDIHCAFVQGKSRLTPMKTTVSIPRLELSAAATATKLNNMILRELDLPVDDVFFWTDSTCTLGYIANQDKRFKVFVANKLAAIHESTQVSQWHYVNTKLNPADDASRGLSAQELVSNKRWLNGPDFLWSNEDDWPQPPESNISVSEDDPEVKEEINSVSFSTITETDPIDRMIHYYSSWHRLKKHFALILRYRDNLQHAVRLRKESGVVNQVKGTFSPITTEEMQRAQTEILKHVQKRSFPEEMILIEESTSTNDDTSTRSQTSYNLKKSSQIADLDPVKVSGLLRVGGRLRRSTIEDESKHPVILPKSHHVVDLIVTDAHIQSGHSGQEHVLSLIRNNFWIIKARTTVRKLTSRCIACKRRQAKPSNQKMADLPLERVTPDKPPFSFVGVDCFGPFLVKRGRSQVKRYGILYTCLALRAIHIEVLHSMDTDSFINSLRRFMARRGRPEVIRSDNGTNFVAGNKELSQAIDQWNSQKIHEFLLQRQVKWVFNPPAASHQGGSWERCIRTVRKILHAISTEQVLDDEGLTTLFCEVEYIVNSRPITKVSNDPDDLEPLSPNHLLLMRAEPSLPPGIFTGDDIYAKRKWKQVQYLADVFWRRWVREYLPTLQRRQKWQKPTRNFAVNDIVLVIDDKLPRCSWPLGRITEVYQSTRDGCVRSVTVKTKTSVLDRPVTKLVLLEAVEVSEADKKKQ